MEVRSRLSYVKVWRVSTLTLGVVEEQAIKRIALKSKGAIRRFIIQTPPYRHGALYVCVMKEMFGSCVFLAKMIKDPVKDKLKRFGLFTRFGEQLFFPTIGEAVSAYIRTFEVDWVDWEDRQMMETRPPAQ